MAKSEIEKSAESSIITKIQHEMAGIEYTFKVPTMALYLIYAGRFQSATDEPLELMPAVEKFLRRQSVSEEQFDEIWERIEEGEIDLYEIFMDEDSLFMTLSEAMSAGRPTGPSSESSDTSTAKTGKRSTGRSPGKGSTRSE